MEYIREEGPPHGFKRAVRYEELADNDEESSDNDEKAYPLGSSLFGV